MSRESRLAAAAIVALVWLNVYLCRELFFAEAWHFNSMQGSWIALARLGGGGSWWPYWDTGMPMAHTYAPLVPWVARAVHRVTGSGHHLALQQVIGAVYCLGPVTLFVLAWRLTCANRRHP